MDIAAISMDFYAILCDKMIMAVKRKMHLTVLLSENVQTALDHFSTCFGARIAYFDPEMRELKVGHNRKICKYCSLIRTKLFGPERCIESDRRRLAEAAEEKNLVSYICPGGLVEAVYPVYWDHGLTGFVMTGQVRTRALPPARILSNWKTKQGKTADLVQAFSEVPEIPPAKLQSMLGLFSMLARLIAREGVASIRRDVVVEKILLTLRSHPEKPPTLSEAARIVSRSASSVSHSFKAKLGKSFQSCVIETRLDRAEDILRTTPGITVKAAAAAVGFADEFYFSRIFKKYKGVPPSKMKGVRSYQI